MTDKPNPSNFVGVNYGTAKEARAQTAANKRAARGDNSRAHGEAIARRAAKNTPWAPFHDTPRGWDVAGGKTDQ